MSTILLAPSLLFREALERLLLGTPFAVHAHAEGLSELQLLSHEQPKLFIVAASEKDGAEGLITDLHSRFPSAWIVCLGSSTDARQALAAFRAGANSFLSTSLSSEVLLKSLELVSLGLVVIAPELLQSFTKHLLQDQGEPTPSKNPVKPSSVVNVRSGSARGLSSREMAILQGIQKGDSNKAIARRYDLAEATVKVHVKAILRKLGASNRTQAAIWAMKQQPAPSVTHSEAEEDPDDESSTEFRLSLGSSEVSSTTAGPPLSGADMRAPAACAAGVAAAVDYHEPVAERPFLFPKHTKTIAKPGTIGSGSSPLLDFSSRSARTEIEATRIETEENIARLRALGLAGQVHPTNSRVLTAS